MNDNCTGNSNYDLVNSWERMDDLGIKNLKLIQNPKYFCFGQDAVLLSGFASVLEGETALDLCCGNGIIPILLYAKNKGMKYYGIEIQPESVDLAKRSIELNGLGEIIDIIHGDIKETGNYFKPSFFDVITVNPPYMAKGAGIANPSSSKAIARHEINVTLEEVISISVKHLKPGGRFYMIHRPFRITDIICHMRENKLEPKTMRLVYPFVNKEPVMVLIEGVRGGRSMLKNRPPLIVYNSDGTYTDEVRKIYYG